MLCTHLNCIIEAQHTIISQMIENTSLNYPHLSSDLAL